ncbi:MAG: glycosyltransferase family 4 protein [Alphaproteobacteria bacterium]|nr:glycosyltransferase family 4 protein [Alphaproteobacteria bacterium]
MLWTSLAVAAGSFFVASTGTRFLISVLRRGAILDHPNDRSSHAVPTPRGAGIAVVGTMLIAWLAVALIEGDPAIGQRMWLLTGVAVLLGLVSWWDDRRGLPVAPRLAAQIVAVLAGLATLGGAGRIGQGLLPEWLDLVATGMAWLWLINLTNFMDGIDGITGVEAGSIGVGVATIAFVAGTGWTSGQAVLLAATGAALSGAAAGFLVWNWAPARVFLGDVGSIPLGLLLGWSLFELAGHGAWAAAILLPLYYLADATLTLLQRIRRGDRLHDAHRSHYFQRAARRFGSHARVSLCVLCLNVGLIGLAIWSTLNPTLAWLPLVLGAVATSLLLAYFHGPRAIGSR